MASNNSAGKTDNGNEKGSEESVNRTAKVPPISFSSSDDEEFFDAENDQQEDQEEVKETSRVVTKARSHDEPDYGDEHEDFDALVEDDQEDDVGNVQQQHGSVIMHLLSQVSVGMDLTKVTLPTFILERRSLLEMYADFFAHPDDFVSSTDLPSPEERFIAVVRFYLSAFYAARKSSVAKKPYNPILGEIFRCRWPVPGMNPSKQIVNGGPFPGSDTNQLTFLAEQVSHHPPISGFYAEHPGKKISFNAHICTKSSFLGLSIGVTNVGFGSVTLHEHGEVYVMTFPNGYGRSIISIPWIELGGKVNISCAKTGYSAEVEFLTKPFFGGKAHKIIGNLYRPSFKKPILQIKGKWNGVTMAKPLSGDEFVFFDAKAKSEVKKECDRISDQGDRESRRLWRHVTCALKRDRIQTATAAKRWIEQRQRDEAKQRAGAIWTPKNFRREGDEWKFVDSLANR